MDDTDREVKRTGIHAAAVVVEPDAVRVALRRGHPAPGVVSLRGGAVRAPHDISGDAEFRAVGGWDGAAMARVDRRLVVGVVVDALDDVDLAARGPVRAVAPERGPSATPGRHVHGVEQDEPAGIREGRRDAHRPPVARDGRRRVDAHNRMARGIDLDEVRGLLRMAAGDEGMVKRDRRESGRDVLRCPDLRSRLFRA